MPEQLTKGNKKEIETKNKKEKPFFKSKQKEIRQTYNMDIARRDQVNQDYCEKKKD